MDTGRVLLITGLILILVIVFNVILYFASTSRSTRQQLRIIGKLAKQARNPWQSEDEALAELRERITELESVEDDEQEEPQS
ncbi:MAG TPA: hypothetical protein G4O08_12640 [Anaerolineae bacterium]|nr:hypothetical protein [Anaerolineae bacterium]